MTGEYSSQKDYLPEFGRSTLQKQGPAMAGPGATALNHLSFILVDIEHEVEMFTENRNGGAARNTHTHTHTHAFHTTYMYTHTHTHTHTCLGTFSQELCCKSLL